MRVLDSSSGRRKGCCNFQTSTDLKLSLSTRRCRPHTSVPVETDEVLHCGARLFLSLWIRCPAGSTAGLSRSHSGPDPESGASGTYVVAPYGRMPCAMLACWHYPRVNGQTLVNPTHSSSWDREAQVTMATGGL